MKDTTLSVGISADCTWHSGSVYVASHVGPDVLLEQLAADMSVHRVGLVSVGSIGNAAPRICSWQGVLWLACRDSRDLGFLMRLDTGEMHRLGKVFGQRPFAFGFGSLAVQNDAAIAAVLQLSLPGVNSLTNVPIAPTGLSHIDRTGRVWTWDEMRLKHAALFPPPALPASGFCEDNGVTFGIVKGRRGLYGVVIGEPGYFVLPTPDLLDPRVSVQGPDIAVVARTLDGPIYLAVVTRTDRVPNIPPPPVHPPDEPPEPPEEPPPDVEPPVEPPDEPPVPPGDDQMKSIEWGNIPFDVHGRQKQRIADLLTQHGHPREAQHALDDDQIVGVYVDQTLKVANIPYKGVLPGEYAQWEADVFAHIARELRRLFGLPADPNSPPALDFQ